MLEKEINENQRNARIKKLENQTMKEKKNLQLT